MVILLIASIFLLSLSGCSQEAKEKPVDLRAKTSNMKTICELVVMEVYYHNVAKFKKEAKKILLWKKDKHFWIEYSGIVKVGIDVSLLNIVVNEDLVEITIPNVKVLDYKVDQESLSDESYIYAKDSAEISAEDETKALKFAQIEMLKAASKDTGLLASAQKRAQKLLEEYINTIGNAIGKKYSIRWNYIEDENTLLNDIERVEDND